MSRRGDKQRAARLLSPAADCEYDRWLGFATLLIVGDHPRCRFAHFKLVAYFLDLRRLRFETCNKGFDFLLLLRYSHLEVLLLLRDGRFVLGES